MMCRILQLRCLASRVRSTVLAALLITLGPATLLAPFNGQALAAAFSTEGISFEIPAGFEGPTTLNVASGKMFIYAKPSSVSNLRALLQLTIVQPPNGGIPNTLTEQELAYGTEKVMLDFLKGVERKRTQFTQSKVVHFQLGGKPASKVSWKGNVDGILVSGVMYCVIVNGKIVLFHAQDAGGEPTASMLEAMKAIERAAVR